MSLLCDTSSVTKNFVCDHIYVQVFVVEMLLLAGLHGDELLRIVFGPTSGIAVLKLKLKCSHGPGSQVVAV